MPICVSCGREAMSGELICYDCKKFAESTSWEPVEVIKPRREDTISEGRLKNAYEYANRKFKYCTTCGESVCTAEMAQFCEFVRVGKNLLEKELTSRGIL